MVTNICEPVVPHDFYTFFIHLISLENACLIFVSSTILGVNTIGVIRSLLQVSEKKYPFFDLATTTTCKLY